MNLGFDFTLPRPYEAGSGEAIVRLSRGYTAIVDRPDLDWISAHGWSVQIDRNSGQAYAFRTVGQGKVFAKEKHYLHRAIADYPLGLVVDHWNGDGLDCRRLNLRTLSHSWNAQNRGRSRERRGVNYANGQWRARIQVHGRRIWLGAHSTVEDAMAAYDEAALRWYGPFALTNLRQSGGPPPLAFVIPEAIPF